jgi:hypothetical protein
MSALVGSDFCQDGGGGKRGRGVFVSLDRFNNRAKGFGSLLGSGGRLSIIPLCCFYIIICGFLRGSRKHVGGAGSMWERGGANNATQILLWGIPPAKSYFGKMRRERRRSLTTK